MTCCICEKEIPVERMTGWDKGNNAEPVKSGRCCNVCNETQVIPARLRLVGIEVDVTKETVH